MNIEDALEYMAQCAGKTGSEQYDILAGESQDNSVQVFKRKVKAREISSSQGIGIRLFKDKKPGYSFTRKLSKEAIEQCVKDASELSAFSSPVDFKLPKPSELPDLDLIVWNEALEKLDTEDFLKLSFELEAKAEKSSKLVENVLSAAAGKSKSSFYLLNSEGLVYNSKRNSVIAGVSLVAAKGNIKKTGGKYKSTRFFEEIDSSEIVDYACQKAIELLDAKPIEAGTYPVLFDFHMAPALLRSLMPALNAEMVQKGQSKFAGKLNSKIAASCLSICNDPFIKDLPGSGIIDSEGVPTQKFNVIENGILKSYLYNLESAQKDGVVSTGNGMRSYTGKAGTGFHNLIVPKGERSKAEILQDLDKCLLVTKFEGSGIRSAISGEISLGCQGFLYEKGKLSQAVDRITVSGNYFDLIQNIVEFSNEYSDSFSSTKIPDMLIESMNISC